MLFFLHSSIAVSLRRRLERVAYDAETVAAEVRAAGLLRGVSAQAPGGCMTRSAVAAGAVK
jgi:hypothetical protein